MYKLFSLILLLLSSHFVTANDHHVHGYVGYHGMAVLPINGKLFAYHLPLYVAPHDYQILYEIEVTTEMSQRLKSLGLITLLPEKFDLNDLITGKTVSLTATFYDGHFERGGHAIKQTSVKFTKPYLIQKVEATKENTQAPNFNFMPVRIDETTSLAIHIIDRRPSFDAITLLHNSRALAQNPVTAPIKCSKTQQQINQKSINNLIADCFHSKLIYSEFLDFR